MSLLGIFSNQTDQEYTAKLISSINSHNVDDSCNAIAQILQTSKEINRKTLLPLCDVALSFMKEKKFEFASTIIYLFIRAPTIYLKPTDLTNILNFSVKSQELQNSSLLESIAELCTKTINTKEELLEIVENPLDLVAFCAQANNPNVLRFISKIISLDQSLKVPFVFDGLIEKLMPTIGTNKTNCRVLASLLSDSQTKKYFSEMGNIPQLITILFDTGISSHVTQVFRSLLSTEDLTYLKKMQEMLFSKDVPKQLLFTLFHTDEAEATLINAAVILGDCFQYFPLQSMPFNYNEFLDLASKKPSLRVSLLYMLESFCLANPDIRPPELESLHYEKLDNDPFFQIFCAYLCHDSTKYTSIDFSKYSDLTGRQLCFAIILASQCRTLFPGAEVLSQTQENETVAELASINCLVCQKYSERLKYQLVQNAVTFFSMEHDVNVGTYQPLFFPRAFLDWGKCEFSEASLSRWILSSTQYAISDTINIFDREPDETSINVLQMCNMISQVREEIDTLASKKEQLLIEAEESEKRRGEAEMALIEARCRAQLLK